MGRRPLKKNRKSDVKLTEKWLLLIIPFFQQNGFNEYTMDEVVKIAGVSKATFYKYFSSKEKLIDAIVEWKVRELSEFQLSLMNESLSYYERYFNAIRITASAMTQISSKFLNDLQSSFPEKWKYVEEFRAYAVNVLESFYAEGVAKGELIDVNPKLIAMLDYIFFQKMSDPEFLKQSNLTLHDAYVEYMKLKNEGIIKNKEGIAFINKQIIEMDSSI